MATRTPSSWREQLYHLIVAGGVGLGVGFLLALGQRPGERWVSIVYGLLVGLGISLISRSVFHLLHDRLYPLAGARRTLAYGTVFLISGVASWVLAGLLINLSFGRASTCSPAATSFPSASAGPWRSPSACPLPASTG
jgi:hypothetical protein